MEYTIYVGSMLTINQGIFKGNFKLMYCGMPSEDTFVLSPFIASNTYQGFSPSIFYRSNAEIIQVMEKQFEVITVHPEYIVLLD